MISNNRVYYYHKVGFILFEKNISHGIRTAVSNVPVNEVSAGSKSLLIVVPAAGDPLRFVCMAMITRGCRDYRAHSFFIPLVSQTKNDKRAANDFLNFLGMYSWNATEIKWWCFLITMSKQRMATSPVVH